MIYWGKNFKDTNDRFGEDEFVLLFKDESSQKTRQIYEYLLK